MKTACLPCLLAIVVLTACSSSDSDKPDSGAKGPDAGAQYPGGKVVATADSKAFVSLPPNATSGALPDVTIVERPSAGFPDEAKLKGPVFELGPDGQTFDAPVTVAIQVPGGVAAGAPLALYSLKDKASGSWQELPGSMRVGTYIVAQTKHFSFFGVQTPATAPPACQAPTSSSPLVAPGTISVSGATKTDSWGGGAGPNQIELGSTWVADQRNVQVSGNAGPAGTGAYIDWSKQGGGTFLIGAGGAFSFTLDVKTKGAHFGVTDACLAPTANKQYGWLYSLNIHCGPGCQADPKGGIDGGVPANPCAGVTCSGVQWCDPATGKCANPLGGQGECDKHPNSGNCGSSGVGKCVHGYCMMEIIMDGSTDGRAVCKAEGLTCTAYPVFVPPEAACRAFHPTAAVTSSASGWRQSVYCDNNSGAACQAKTNTCHNCPACKVATGPSGCLQKGTQLFQTLFVNCTP